ncbi:unnamed protein product [Cylicocyclus nassatus]|uniref:C2H2-type domain-containing protein n=1 Tax=Cylicocyclus nassatus TaxID=53992 RepID=A0AA36M187_CYLNA|nr:unnamed protein product [Cylicocyclus nassatus]
MDYVQLSSSMGSGSTAVGPVVVQTDTTPPSMETDSGNSYSLTDLSSCRASVEEQPMSNGWSYQDELFAHLDFEPTTSGSSVDAIPVTSADNPETEVEDDNIYKYYYMLEDSHEDVLRKLEEELVREESEEQSKVQEVSAKLKELEKGAREWVHIDKLQKRKVTLSKSAQEKKAERERIARIRRELAIANREREFFCCFVCSRVFTDEEAMRQHVSEKHLAAKKNFNLKCPHCYLRFTEKRLLTKHMKFHKDASFTCEVCKFQFKEHLSLKVHMSRAHGLSLDGTEIVKKHECKCGQKFGLMEELKRHRYYCDNRESITEKRRIARQELDAMSVISSPAPSTISSCSESTSGISIGSTSGRPVKDKSCPFCFLVCASMQSRRRHIERKHPEKLGEEEVEIHSYIKVHSPALPFACPLCAKTFSNHASLSRHKKRIHENIKDFVCSTCGKSYPIPSELRKHMKRVHNILEC